MAALPDDGWLLTGSVHEFWWPRGSSLSARARRRSAGVRAVDALVRLLVTSPDDGRPLLERTVARVGHPPSRVTASRSSSAAVSSAGSEPRRPVTRSTRRALRGWCPIEVLSVAPDDVTEPARLVEDTRLRDALRAIGAGARPDFRRPTVDEDADFGIEVAALLEADVVAARQRIDDLERRLVELEQARPAARIRAAARRAARGVRRRGVRVIVLVLLVRDEDDILESMLAYHLAAGVDHVVATDHRSRDGTTDILRSFEQRGVLSYLRDDREVLEQGEP